MRYAICDGKSDIPHPISHIQHPAPVSGNPEFFFMNAIVNLSHESSLDARFQIAFQSDETGALLLPIVVCETDLDL